MQIQKRARTPEQGDRHLPWRGLKRFLKTEKKHDIKRVERRCGNPYFHFQRVDL